MIKAMLLWLISIVLVIWLAQQGASFRDDYQQMYDHEQCTRRQDTAFYQLNCGDPAVAEETGQTAKCHAIGDRHKRTVEAVAWRAALDKYNVCDVQCVKRILFDATTITLVVAVAAVLLCTCLLTLLRSPRDLPHANAWLPFKSKTP